MAATYDRDGCFRRTEDADVFIPLCGIGERPAISLGSVPFVRRDNQARQPPERRIAGALALLDFVSVERLAIARNQGAYHRMLRLVCLQVPEPTPLLASGAADDLVQQLEGAFRSARIAVSQAQIGVDNAHQIELREMMPFGDKLRADDEIETSCGNVVELLPEPFDRLHEIARQDEDARLRKQLGRFLLEPLDAGTNGRQAFRRVTMRAFSRRRHGKSAIMTDQPPFEPVIDEPGIAVRTLQTKTAGPA